MTSENIFTIHFTDHNNKDHTLDITGSDFDLSEKITKHNQKRFNRFSNSQINGIKSIKKVEKVEAGDSGLIRENVFRLETLFSKVKESEGNDTNEYIDELVLYNLINLLDIGSRLIEETKKECYKQIDFLQRTRPVKVNENDDPLPIMKFPDNTDNSNGNQSS